MWIFGQGLGYFCFNFDQFVKFFFCEGVCCVLVLGCVVLLGLFFLGHLWFVVFFPWGFQFLLHRVRPRIVVCVPVPLPSSLVVVF